MRTLVISTNAIGDSFISLSSIQYIRKSIGGQVHLCLKSESKILEEKLDSEKIYYLKNKSILQIILILFELRKNKYDYAFSFFPGKVNSIILLMTKSKKKYGYKLLANNTEWHSSVNKVVSNQDLNKVRYWEPDMNFMERIRILLESAGLYYSEIEKYRIDVKKHNNKNIIVIHFNSRNEKKSLSLKCLEDLMGYLEEMYDDKIVLLGNGIEIELLKQRYKDSPQIIEAHKLSELVELLIESKIFIGVDSFPLHIADSYNTNFLGLFSISDPKSVLVNYQKGIRFSTDSMQKITIYDLIPSIQQYYDNYKTT